MRTSKLKSLLAGFLLGAAVLTGVCAPTASVLAGTAQVTLKDGTVLEGEIVRELEGIVWLKIKAGRSEETRMLTPGEVKSIVRDGAATKAPADSKPAEKPADKAIPATKPAESPAPAAPASEPASQPRKSGVPRAAVITLGEGTDKDMVGVYVMAKPLNDAIAALKADNVDIVVFRINSGGGAAIEVQKLSDVIYNEFRKNFRTVAWIDWAISAAAMTSHAIEEIYFTPEGAYGACTAYHGDFVAAKDADLERFLFQMEKISTRGNHPFEIMRAMQIMAPLSATVSPSGDVSFYQDETSGDILLNPKDRVLTFNSQSAAKIKFSAGTASTLDELAKAMQLTEVEWVGVKKPGYMWPICRAEQMQMDFREKTYRDEQLFDEYVQTLNQVLGMGSGMDDERRAKLAGKARECMNKIVAAVNNNPNMATFKFGIMPEKFREEWVEPTEKKIKELTKKEKK
ncbi:MAG: hypothetical protein JNK16_07505 [Phycisphaerales bacterium]|nr:hypothetical protein [Phycisphaerales bacterium]